jgi:hypothetical protein
MNSWRFNRTVAVWFAQDMEEKCELFMKKEGRGEAYIRERR